MLCQGPGCMVVFVFWFIWSVLFRCCHGGRGSKTSWSEDVQIYSKAHPDLGKWVSLLRELWLSTRPWCVNVDSVYIIQDRTLCDIPLFIFLVGCTRLCTRPSHFWIIWNWLKRSLSIVLAGFVQWLERQPMVLGLVSCPGCVPGLQVRCFSQSPSSFLPLSKN